MTTEPAQFVRTGDRIEYRELTRRAEAGRQACAAPESGAQHAVATLIESLARQQRYWPTSAYPVNSLDDLPIRFRVLVDGAGMLAGWRACTDGIRLWFTVGWLRQQASTDIGLLTLEAHFFDQDALVAAAGEWTLMPNGCWTLSRLLDAPALAPDPVHRIIHNRTGVCP